METDLGGNAFPRLAGQMSRIHRADIAPLLGQIADRLAFPGLTEEYLRANLMGSAGRQDTSGDLDFAINVHKGCCLGEPDLPIFDFVALAERAAAVLPSGHVVIPDRRLTGNQFNTAWPVSGRLSGFVQVDFIAGVPEWLKFSHWSPGLDVSPWSGVLISTLFGVLAKMHVDFERIENAERTRRVSLRYDLELGLRRAWQLQRRPGQGISEVTPDQFEAVTPEAPRFARIGYVTSPEAAVEMLFGQPIPFADIATFERATATLRAVMPERYEEACARTIESFLRSSAVLKHTSSELATFLGVSETPWSERDH